MPVSGISQLWLRFGIGPAAAQQSVDFIQRAVHD
jgi:hypothetical protein